MKAIFEVVPSDWKRKQYFDYYYYAIKTKYNINYHIEISELRKELDINKLKFYPTFLYIVSHIVNQNEEFRMSFDGNNRLGIWNYVVPSYTIFHDDDKTFSDIWSDYTPVFRDFYLQIVEDMKKYKNVKTIKAKENRPANFCPISVIPWLSFQSLCQDTYTESSLLFPIVRFGKYYNNGGKTFLPFSIFVNHAVADGYHTSKLINEIEEFCKRPSDWLKI